MANEMLKFLNGQSSNLASKTVQAGQVYFAINSDGETGSIYFDAPISSSVTKRIAMSGQTVQHANEADYATYDALGNEITDTYISQMRLDSAGTKIQYKYPGSQTWSELQPLFLPLAGGQITNDLSVNGTITAGNLIVNGAARFTQTILGNIQTADKWSTARNFAVSDATAAHTGTSVSVDGSAAVTIPLPATITATLKGNADTATTATNANNLQAYNSNEVTIGANNTTAGSSTNSAVYINHKDRSNGSISNGSTQITDYYFENRKGATTGVTIHAATFAGNASSANIWSTGRKFSISDNDASHTGTQVSVNGSTDYVLPLPATIKATLEGNADSATKATKDSNDKTITDEYLHRAANSSSTLSQFSGAPQYLLGIEPFASGGAVKWQAVADVTVGKATKADTWTTSRNFAISDATAAHTGNTVSVNGGAAVTLPLPATITADVVGNASTASTLTLSASTTSASNLNNFLEASKIKATYISSAVTYSDGTLSANDGYVISMSYSNTNYGNQIFFDPDSDKISIRHKSSTWGPWVDLIHTGNISSFVSPSADTWSTARSFAISDDSAKNTGTSVSVDGSADVTLPLPNQIYLTGNHAGFINGGETDKFFDFAYGANPTTSSGASWRIGALNSGSGDTNYFVIQTGGSTTSSTTWNNALRIGMNTLDIHVGGNLNPLVNNSKTLGTSSLKWANVYATKFTGDLVGNADTATVWKTGRKFSVSDADATNTGTQVTVDGSADYVLPLPSTIKATLSGNATTATTATNAYNVLAYSSNEVTLGANSATVGSSSNDTVWINYRDVKGGAINNGATQITNYHFGNRKGAVTGVTVYAETFNGNATTATKWKNSISLAVADNSAAHTGTAENVDGSGNVTLKLPATITATLSGNASSATKTYVTIADTTKFYLIGSTNTSSGNADLKEDTGLYAGTTKGQLGAAYVGINGDNTSYRLYVNGTSLFTGYVNINTSTGTLQIGSQNSNWTHFNAQRPFYFSTQASINGHFLPYTDLAYDLGDSTHRWANIYTNILRLQGASSDPSSSGGARIEFTYDDGSNRSQPVYIAYTPNDSYRAPYGLKIMDNNASDSNKPWFEVEGAIYSGGTIYATLTTDSSSTSTGSIVASGGVGIAKQLRVGGNTNLGGTLGVSGATTLGSTLTVTGNATLNGTLTVASGKATTLGGTLGVTGIATFSNQIIIEKDSDSAHSGDGTASIVTEGGISVKKQLSAKIIKIDNGQTTEGCQLKYNETNNCLEFIFS